MKREDAQELITKHDYLYSKVSKLVFKASPWISNIVKDLKEKSLQVDSIHYSLSEDNFSTWAYAFIPTRWGYIALSDPLKIEGEIYGYPYVIVTFFIAQKGQVIGELDNEHVYVSKLGAGFVEEDAKDWDTVWLIVKKHSSWMEDYPEFPKECLRGNSLKEEIEEQAEVCTKLVLQRIIDAVSKTKE